MWKLNLFEKDTEPLILNTTTHTHISDLLVFANTLSSDEKVEIKREIEKCIDHLGMGGSLDRKEFFKLIRHFRKELVKNRVHYDYIRALDAIKDIIMKKQNNVKIDMIDFFNFS